MLAMTTATADSRAMVVFDMTCPPFGRRMLAALPTSLGYFLGVNEKLIP
jgi:hypothetical protein